VGQFLKKASDAGREPQNRYDEPLGDTMSQAAPSTESIVSEMSSELVDLQKLIDALPVESKLAIQPAFLKVVDSTNRRRKILQLVQESIGQLRLDMKYLVFDLEATRRERDLFQAQLAEFMGNEGLPPSPGPGNPSE
jgi:hypothetical protein